MPVPHHTVFVGQMPFLPPNQQRQSTKGSYHTHYQALYECPVYFTSLVFCTGLGCVCQPGFYLTMNYGAEITCAECPSDMVRLVYQANVSSWCPLNWCLLVVTNFSQLLIFTFFILSYFLILLVFFNIQFAMCVQHCYAIFVRHKRFMQHSAVIQL